MGLKEKIKAGIDYARLTFILSFLGFLGSIGFYFGVIRQIYSPVRDKQKIERLEHQVEVLTDAVANYNDYQIK